MSSQQRAPSSHRYMYKRAVGQIYEYRRDHHPPYHTTGLFPNLSIDRRRSASLFNSRGRASLRQRRRPFSIFSFYTRCLSILCREVGSLVMSEQGKRGVKDILTSKCYQLSHYHQTWNQHRTSNPLSLSTKTSTYHDTLPH